MSRRDGKRSSATRRVGAGLGVGLIAWLVGCAPVPVEMRQPTPPSFRLAVLDFRVPEEWRDPIAPDRMDKELKGWWLSSKDVWHNPIMGREAGNIFSHKFQLLPFVNGVSRVDIKYYLAEKRELIKRELDEKRNRLEESTNPRDLQEALRIREMSESDYERMLEREIDTHPREVGLELKSDRVLLGRIHDCYIAHNRTIHWYWSYVDLEVRLVEVDTGRVVWHKRSQFKKNLASVSFVLEHAADRMIEAMKFEYLYQQR